MSRSQVVLLQSLQVGLLNAEHKRNIRLQELTKTRFLEKIKISNSGCWEWHASLNNVGYGRFFYQGKLRRAHRFSYELHKGPISEGLVIDHLCKNRRCVNPDHLYIKNIEEGLEQNYVKLIDEYKEMRKEYANELDTNQKIVVELNNQIQHGVEIKEIKEVEGIKEKSRAEIEDKTERERTYVG